MNLLAPLTRRFDPDYDRMSDINRRYATMTVAVILYAVPLALGGLVWLVRATDWASVRAQAPVLAALLLLAVLFEHYQFSLTTEIRPGMYSTVRQSFEGLAVWSGALIFGVSAIWPAVLSTVLHGVREWREDDTAEARRQHVRNFTLKLSADTLPWLVVLSLYSTRWGGTLPLSGFTAAALRPAALAALVAFALVMAIYLPQLVLFAAATLRDPVQRRNARPLLQSWLTSYGIDLLLLPAVVAVACLYAVAGPGVYLFFVANGVLASAVASQMGRASELNRRRSRELEQIEQLGRALLTAPPDASSLPDLLTRHLPGMFAYTLCEVFIFEEDDCLVLARAPADSTGWAEISEGRHRWLRENPGEHILSAGAATPWDGRVLDRHTLLIPLSHPESGSPLGGLFLARPRVNGLMDELVPAAQALAAQISSALQRAEAHQEQLRHERTQQELAVAAEIQASFLPVQAPELEGWEISASLLSARETSGDFFDLIPLWDGRMAVAIADVADKGIGAALYMALVRTLLRTYATEYSTRYPDSYAYHPERVVATVNQSILTDTRSDLFATVFFGFIDPRLGSFTYVNAGHNPPLLFEANGDCRQARALVNTGIPVGILADTTWERGSLRMKPGDTLVLYTDGLTEAQDHDGAFFGEARLVEVVCGMLGRAAAGVRLGITTEVRAFMAGRPPHDDITLLVVRRTEATEHEPEPPEPRQPPIIPPPASAPRGLDMVI